MPRNVTTMVEPRFYDPELDSSAAQHRLAGDEGHHLAKVLRLRAGARLRLFDGRGVEVRAEVLAVEKAAATLRVLERVAAAREPAVRLTLAQAVLKGEKMDAVVRDATMMGVAAIQPLLAERTVVPARAVEAATLRDRWRRVAIASAKQCGRAVVPEILAAREAIDPGLGASDAWRAVLLEPSALGSHGSVEPPRPAPQAAALMVGPEGGWTAEEVEAALAAGWQPWSLGALTLRAEAAPLAALAILRWLWRETAGA